MKLTKKYQFQQSERYYWYKHNNAEKCVVMIPGWGEDSSIFKLVDFETEMVIMDNVILNSFKAELKEILNHIKSNNIIILAHSMAANLVLKHWSVFSDKNVHLLCVGTGCQYSEETINQQQILLKKDLKNVIYEFNKLSILNKKHYKNWVSEDASLQLNKFSVEELYSQLEFLKTPFVQCMTDKIVPITMLYGTKDAVINLTESQAIASQHGLTVKLLNCSHMPFYQQHIVDEINHYVMMIFQTQLGVHLDDTNFEKHIIFKDKVDSTNDEVMRIYNQKKKPQSFCLQIVNQKVAVNGDEFGIPILMEACI